MMHSPSLLSLAIPRDFCFFRGNISTMKNLLILIFAFSVIACTEKESPEPLIARAIIGQRVSQSSIWRAALVPFGDNINAEELRTKRGYFQEYEVPIEPNQPFALIFEVVDWDGQLNILMKISEKDVRLVTIPDSLPLREVYIHPNGNLPAAEQMAASITFPCEILILK
jgi:hypothetical protein